MLLVSSFAKDQQDVIALCLAFGLRCREAILLCYKDMTISEEKIEIVVPGFAGYHRTITAIRTYEPELRKVIREKGVHNPEDLFIDHKISKYLDIHALRIKAAKAHYKELKVDGELSEEEILKKVTKFLGHNRVETTLKFYLS